MRQNTLRNSPQQESAPKTRKQPQRLSEVAAPSELPQFIKGEELTQYRPFTIYGCARMAGRYGEKFHFDIAFKIDGEVNKRVLTLSVNRDREAISKAFHFGGPIVNCRLIKLNTSPTTTYWKIIDNDDPIPDEVSTASLTADDIPF